jgi:hypothetical protein
MGRPVSKDCSDEHAAEGILVVPVCRLRTVSRKISQAARMLTRVAVMAAASRLRPTRFVKRPTIE